MPYDSKDRKIKAEQQIRRPDGTFVHITSETKLVPADPDLEKPLVAVSVNNPFKKLLQWFDQIRRNQNTTFTIKLKLPFIVLLTLFIHLMSMITSSKLFYDWGKIAGISAVLALPQPTPVVITTPPDNTSAIQTTKLGILKGLYVADTSNPTRYVLEDKKGEILIIVAPATLSLKQYIGNRVLITGEYQEADKTLRVRKTADIEVIR